MQKVHFIPLFFLLTTMPVGAQDVNTLNIGQDSPGQFQGNGNIEDSDNVLKYDYYSGVFMVRSGSQYYSVVCDELYGNKNMLFATIRNTTNTVVNGPDYDRISGEQLYDAPQFYNPDEEQMSAIIREVFPQCILGIDKTRNRNYVQYLSIVMSVDPDTEKVIDMIFTIYSDKPGVQKQNTPFSIPPSKLRRLEELIKGKVTVKIPDVAKYHTYLRSSYHVYFLDVKF